jgi:hypothetical protein
MKVWQFHFAQFCKKNALYILQEHSWNNYSIGDIIFTVDLIFNHSMSIWCVVLLVSFVFASKFTNNF